MHKGLSSIFRRDRGTSKSLFLADRSADRDGMSETGVSIAAVTDTAESCVIANTTYTNSSQ